MRNRIFFGVYTGILRLFERFQIMLRPVSEASNNGPEGVAPPPRRRQHGGGGIPSPSERVFKYPITKYSGPNSHAGYGFWNQKPHR